MDFSSLKLVFYFYSPTRVLSEIGALGIAEIYG